MSNTLFGNRSKRARDEPPRTEHATCTFRVRQNKIIQVLEHFLRGKKVSLFHVKFQCRFVEGICGCFWSVTLSTTQCHFNQLLCVCQVSGKKKKRRSGGSAIWISKNWNPVVHVVFCGKIRRLFYSGTLQRGRNGQWHFPTKLFSLQTLP